jgi:hypothetical protein
LHGFAAREDYLGFFARGGSWRLAFHGMAPLRLSLAPRVRSMLWYRSPSCQLVLFQRLSLRVGRL